MRPVNRKALAAIGAVIVLFWVLFLQPGWAVPWAVEYVAGLAVLPE